MKLLFPSVSLTCDDQSSVVVITNKQGSFVDELSSDVSDTDRSSPQSFTVSQLFMLLCLCWFMM